MSEPSTDRPSESAPTAPGTSKAAAPAQRSRTASARLVSVLWGWLVAGVLAVVSFSSMAVAWKTQQRVQALEQELVRRQQESQSLAAESRTLAKQAQDNAREAAAKSALLEMRVAEVAMQRSQFDDLMQSLSRSRDENVLIDVETALRVASQQASITGSAEPLVAALRQADERLARYGQPRLEGVRRAITRDVERIKATGLADVSTLNVRLDEAVRMVDELPLLAAAEARVPSSAGPTAAAAASAPASMAAASAVPEGTEAEPPAGAWWDTLQHNAGRLTRAVWNEARSLVRVTRIDHPDAMLLAPDQGYFVRENLKLRLLNARLAVLSRQFDSAQSDLAAARATVDRYFDTQSRRVVAIGDLLRQVSTQARQLTLPRPDETLAAVHAATAGR